MQNQGRSDPIHAGSEGQAGITPADESHPADRRVRPTAGDRPVFAIQGILRLNYCRDCFDGIT
mgnify:CR=1 FL=1